MRLWPRRHRRPAMDVCTRCGARFPADLSTAAWLTMPECPSDCGHLLVDAGDHRTMAFLVGK